MSTNLPPTNEGKLRLVSIFLQALLYGVFIVLFSVSLWLFGRKRSIKSRTDLVVLGILFALFTFSTMHLSVNLTRIIRGFITFGDDIGGPNAYFDKTSDFTNVFSCTIYVFQAVVGELFFLYRSAMIWGTRWWVAILPALFFVTSTLAGIGNIDAFIHLTSEKIFTVQHTHWKFFFAFAFSGNVICTGLIARKLYESNILFNSTVSKNMKQILFVVVDSGAIYSTMLFILLVVHLTSTTTEYLLLDAFSPLLGITVLLMDCRLTSGLCTPEGRICSLKHVSRTATTNTLDVTLVNREGAPSKTDRASVGSMTIDEERG